MARQPVEGVRGSKEASSSTSDVASTQTQHYDVFLSHRGPDSKKTLVDHLNELLTAKGLSTCVDYTMKSGEPAWPTILQAIRNSCVQVVVLSPDFASSAWCLDEVYEIMQLPSSSSAVLPIFYNVQPTDLRFPKPGTPFDLTSWPEKRASREDCDRWARALSQLSYIKGFRLDETNGFEGKLASKVVDRAIELVHEKLPLHVDPFWVDYFSTHLEDAEMCLDLSANSDDKVVSIGVTGLNKSIFAKLLFNKLKARFSASCILLDIREQAKPQGGLTKLQSKLLKDLVMVDKDIQHIDKGLPLLHRHLHNIKCFIVLDDIGTDMEQLNSLYVRNRHNFGGGSRLVFTSRYPHVLQSAQVDKTLSIDTCTERGSDLGKSSLTIFYESKDVHGRFIDHLKESFSMLGLRVFLKKQADLLRESQLASAPNMTFIVILSWSCLDSPTLLGEVDKASRCPDANLVYIFYGLEKSATETFLKSMQTIGHASTSIPSSRPSIGRQLLRTLSQKAVHYCAVDLDRPQKSAIKTLITDIVSNHLHYTHKVSVTEFPVGLMERQEKLEKLISSTSDGDVVSVGIVGMGGIGKTTLVKSLYNKIHRNFEGPVLLLDVREEANKNGLLHLQKAILNSVLGDDPVVTNLKSVEEGKVLLSRRLSGTKTLVILDDVDDEKQLSALLSPMALGNGSLVIITSRNRDVLGAAEVDKMYVMELLSSESAKTLFLWHAFLQPRPPCHLQDIAQKVIDACQGLPLSLQIIGAHVYGHDDTKFWEETLVHLQREHRDIFDRLRVSVDALKPEQIEAFLDVACFLIGRKAETAIRFWRGCGLSSLHCLEVLKNKCLITVDSTDGLIGMHDHIRDMGRDIAGQRSPKTHVWEMKDVYDISNVCVDQLRGFSWLPQEETLCTPHALNHIGRSFSSLKLLLLGNLHVRTRSRLWLSLLRNLHRQGGIPNSQIRWLQWHEYPFKVLPPELCSRELRVLDLSRGTRLKALWRSSDATRQKMPEELTELILDSCKRLEELPQFDLFLHQLEWLNLRRCKKLKYLHNSIGSLTKLKFLDLSWCRSLQSLPQEIQGLCSLEILLLDECLWLESLPEGVCQLQKLREISLNFTSLRTLPASFCELKNLEKLSLIGTNIIALPHSVGCLEMLTDCNLRLCEGFLELPTSFCELVNLQTLNFRRCDLTDLPENIGNLQKLRFFDLSKNGRLRRLPSSVGNLHSLQDLRLRGCALEDEGMPSELERLVNLERLEMGCNDNILSFPPSFAGLGNLSKLFIQECRELIEVAFFPYNLRHVYMGQCPKLKRVRGLDLAKSLERLVLCECDELEEVDGLGGIENLQELDITGCRRLCVLPGLQKVKRLWIGGSGVAPSANLLEVSTLEHITWYGSGMPGDFADNCTSAETGLIMTIEVPGSMNKAQLPFAVLLWLATGNDPCALRNVEATLSRNGSRVAGQLLMSRLDSPDHLEFPPDGLDFTNSLELLTGLELLEAGFQHPPLDAEVHLMILRPGCEVLRMAQAQDRLEIRATLWKDNPIKHSSYMVVQGGPDQLQACLQNISVWAKNVAVP